MSKLLEIEADRDRYHRLTWGIARSSRTFATNTS